MRLPSTFTYFARKKVQQIYLIREKKVQQIYLLHEKKSNKNLH